MYVRMCVRMYACMHVCMHACMHVCVRALFVCSRQCLCVCLCAGPRVCRFAALSVGPFRRAAARSKRGGERFAGPPAAFPTSTSGFSAGSAGDTSCPSGKATVLIPAQCQNAAASVARPYGSFQDSRLPTGCLFLTVGVGGVGSLFSNEIPAGIGSFYAQPVCVGAPEC
jgi:hypothetical protein